MKKILNSSLAALFLANGVTLAQVPKKAVVEHFTNTKCSLCASRNPGFYYNLSNQHDVLHLAIHPSSPYNGCLLYQQNATENDARTNFYGIYGGTPRLVINGSVISSGANYADNALFAPYLQQTSPASLKITHIKYGNDSIRSRVVVKTVAPHSLGNLSLFVALAEDTLNYTGSNGEARHYDVFRKALSPVNGYTLTLPATIGDSIVFTGRASTQSFWNFNRITTMAILQESGNKALVQAEKFQSTAVVPTDIKNQAEVSPLIIYPNPGSGVLFIETSLESGELELLNSMGQLVYKEMLATGKNKIDLSDFTPGIYFVSLSVNNNFISRTKLIIKAD